MTALPQPRRVAVGYARVSVGDVDSLSLAAQESALRAYATAQGLALATVLTDPGVSAGVPLQKRPAGSQLVRQLRHSDADGLVLVAVRLDRLFRSAFEAAKWSNEWLNAGVHLVLLDIGLDLRTPTGKFVLATLAACAELERDLIRLRTKDALAMKRQRHQPVGTPFLGYQVDERGDKTLVHPDEQAAIGFMLECQDKGMSIRTAIGYELRAAGFKPRKRVWHHVTINKTLIRVRRDPSAVALALEHLARWREAKAQPSEAAR
jgi:DNA invertase Pin-like site-specific DNA recombinase